MWFEGAVFYQIFPDRFAGSAHKSRQLFPGDDFHYIAGGSIPAMEKKLEHIVSLGADGIYLNPIHPTCSPNGYDITDYFSVEPRLGGDPAFERFLSSAHQAGLKVVLDLVLNHSSSEHPFFQSAAAGNGYRDWYRFNHDGTYASWWGFPHLPQWNHENPAVWQHLQKVAPYWLEKGVDGLRADVPLDLPEASRWEFWQEVRSRSKAVDPEAYLIGEIWYPDSYWTSACGGPFDALMVYAHAGSILGASSRSGMFPETQYSTYLQRLSPQGLRERMQWLQQVFGSGANSQYNLLGSHDAPRPLTVLGGDKEAYKLAVFLHMTHPGVKSIYNGDELGMEGGCDPDNRRVIPWENSAWDNDILDHHRRLGQLSKIPDLRSGAWKPLLADDETYIYQRGNDTICAVNFSGSMQERQVQGNYSPIHGRGTHQDGHVRLPLREGTIYTRNP